MLWCPQCDGKVANVIFITSTGVHGTSTAIYESQSPSGSCMPVNAPAGPPPSTLLMRWQWGVNVLLLPYTPLPAHAFYALTMTNLATVDTVGNCTNPEVSKGPPPMFWQIWAAHNKS